jgi:hypothetical protein
MGVVSSFRAGSVAKDRLVWNTWSDLVRTIVFKTETQRKNWKGLRSGNVLELQRLSRS